MMRARIDTFITAISKLRLAILTEQGEGACSFFRSSLIYLFIYLHTHTLADGCKGPDADSDAAGRERGAAPG